jgi:hypothetical protein
MSDEPREHENAIQLASLDGIVAMLGAAAAAVDPGLLLAWVFCSTYLRDRAGKAKLARAGAELDADLCASLRSRVGEAFRKIELAEIERIELFTRIEAVEADGPVATQHRELVLALRSAEQMFEEATSESKRQAILDCVVKLATEDGESVETKLYWLRKVAEMAGEELAALREFAMCGEELLVSANDIAAVVTLANDARLLFLGGTEGSAARYHREVFARGRRSWLEATPHEWPLKVAGLSQMVPTYSVNASGRSLLQAMGFTAPTHERSDAVAAERRTKASATLSGHGVGRIPTRATRI